MTAWNQILELVGWEMDEEPDRERCCGKGTIARSQEDAKRLLRCRSAWESKSPICSESTCQIADLLARHVQRTDLQREFHGLQWELHVVDLRLLLSFQRRLVSPDEGSTRLDSGPVSWQERVNLAFPAERKSDYSVELSKSELVLRSANPDFRVLLEDRLERPERCSFRVEHGSPFMEVAHYGGRWFLRDGYHRAWRFMCMGVFEVPVVVIEARTQRELGAVQSWFFSESTLFSERPPAVIRIAVNESFETIPSSLREEKEHEYCNDAR